METTDFATGVPPLLAAADAGQPRPNFADRLAGSSDLFDKAGTPSMGLDQFRGRA